MATLFYKYPNEEKIHQQFGHFHLVTNGTEPIGFVVSDFLHQQIYLFQEDESQPQTMHFSNDEPIVVSQKEYQFEAQALLSAFPLVGVEKAVYSRVKAVQFDARNAKKLFQQLCSTYPTTFCYLISSANFGTWIGATPEVLVNSNQNELTTVALAATHAGATKSSWTDKERAEHEFVVAAIAQTLEQNGCENVQKSEAYEVIAGPVVHLKTDFQASLTTCSAWSVAMDLHPTPAVCGTPRRGALDLISARERHQRALYAGIIGWNNSSSSRLFVNLRCAQLLPETAYLYVGGGFTSDSIPDSEWDETENKARTLLNVMETL